MLNRKSVRALILSVVVILIISLLAAAISLTTQKPINKTDAKPIGLPGIQVTAVNKSNPTAKPQTAVTDAEGGFNLGLLPAGTYALTLAVTDAAIAARNKDVYIKQSGTNRQATSLTTLKITIEGTDEGVVVRGWDVKEEKPVNLTRESLQQRLGGLVDMQKQNPSSRSDQTAKTDSGPDIIFTTDGKQKIKGGVHDASMSAIQNTR
jgi:hypothetical protein